MCSDVDFPGKIEERGESDEDGVISGLFVDRPSAV